MKRQADGEREEQRRTSTHRIPFGLITVAVFSVVGLAACSSANPQNASANGPTVSTEDTAAFGSVLESGGKALYMLQPSNSPCDSACTNIWPPFVLQAAEPNATAGSGVDGSKLGTVSRASGEHQVTYSGEALYFFSEDTAGQVKGNITDLWGKWSVVVVAKPAANANPAATTTPSTAPPAAKAPAAPATTAPAAPATTAPPAPTTTAPPPPPTTTTTTMGGGGGVGF